MKVNFKESFFLHENEKQLWFILFYFDLVLLTIILNYIFHEINV
jgi:hypothetical protein